MNLLVCVPGLTTVKGFLLKYWSNVEIIKIRISVCTQKLLVLTYFETDNPFSFQSPNGGIWGDCRKTYVQDYSFPSSSQWSVQYYSPVRFPRYTWTTQVSRNIMWPTSSLDTRHFRLSPSRFPPRPQGVPGRSPRASGLAPPPLEGVTGNSPGRTLSPPRPARRRQNESSPYWPVTSEVTGNSRYH